jgi:hypothetical protein
MVMDDTVARCAGPGCGRPLAWAATGPPGTAGTTAARPPTARAAEEAAARAARLAEAKTATARLWRPLEEAGFRDVAEHAALVLSCAADPGRPRRELDQALAGLHQAAANLASIARQYRDAADLTRELTDVS